MNGKITAPSDIPFEYRKHDRKCEGPDPACQCLGRFAEKKRLQLEVMEGSSIYAHHELCVYRGSNRERPCSCQVSLGIEVYRADWIAS